jgi:hypothetical protein
VGSRPKSEYLLEAFARENKTYSVDSKSVVSQYVTQTSRGPCFKWNQRESHFSSVAAKHFHGSFNWDWITCQTEKVTPKYKKAPMKLTSFTKVTLVKGMKK